VACDRPIPTTHPSNPSAPVADSKNYPGNELLLNADFDLGLRPRWSGTASRARINQIRELSLHFLLAGSADDSVLVQLPVPDELLTYLEQNRVPLPSPTLLPAINPSKRFAPYGWSQEAATLNQRYQKPSDHPRLDVVARVNSRRFSARLERECFGHHHVVGQADSPAALERLLAADRRSGQSWIIKADHGNAGLGNRRLRTAQLGQSDRRVAGEWLHETDWIVLERWHQRAADLCTTFDVAGSGEVTDLLVHEVVNTADGAFIGAIFEPGSQTVARWHAELSRTAALIAGRLSCEGYFGPVCLDSYVWQSTSGERLRPLVDLNARQHMSLPAIRLWQRWRRQVTLYWRFFSPRKLRLPQTYHELTHVLGRDAYDPDRRHGVLLTSPLRLLDETGAWRPPTKLGVLMAGPDRQAVLGMEQRLRERFEVGYSPTPLP
jgi:hypothetical protein